MTTVGLWTFYRPPFGEINQPFVDFETLKNKVRIGRGDAFSTKVKKEEIRFFIKTKITHKNLIIFTNHSATRNTMGIATLLYVSMPTFLGYESHPVNTV